LDEDFPYGPFHRIQSAEQNEVMERSSTVGGKRPRNIYQALNPKVKAFTGRLPHGVIGIEFYSQHPPDGQLPPGRAEWSADSPGVFPLRTDVDGEEVVGIRVRISRRVDS
jgi:hypothetical protein